MTRPLLVVTAVAAERDALCAGLTDRTGLDVVAVGVGPAAAAAGTARLLALAEVAARPYRGVVCAGIAGGFAGRAPLGATVLGVRAVAADLGAEAPDGFLPLDELGFGAVVAPADPHLLASLSTRLPAAVRGDVLTVSTVTGTATTAVALADRHPDAVAEAMEGYGAACACAAAGVPFVELRTIANLVGPRDRAAWRLADALSALTAAASALDTAAGSHG